MIMTTPSSQFHSQLLLVILVVVLAAAAEGQRPGCPDKCGNISIPFPFGIGTGCFRDGFEVVCNESASGPPRAFLADNGIYKEEANNSESGFDTATFSSSPLELVSISLATAEVRAYAPISYSCSTSRTATFSTLQRMAFFISSFAMSLTRNVLIGVGAEPQLSLDGYNVSCRIHGWPTMESASNGSCMGLGCCEAALSTDHGDGSSITWSKKEGVIYWESLPCSYALLVEKSWYSFSESDIRGNMTLFKKYPRGVPLVLDFVAGETSCPGIGHTAPGDYACVSGNSSCADVTYGYVCKCWDHYAGNPYLPNGCQDIDECKQPQVYPCENGGICKNRLGGYECPCKFGMKMYGNAGTCIDVFPPAAKAAVGRLLLPLF
ncbi:hypothetical protein CFC21_081630 [Triticum aestivum]|uniref:EGF-like domain-containing protein n=2 Tax=Triticum aestivum TaxID=4565 RepID=A0A9R1I4U3_WHEAT|nr:hypothetical protein CFC21_003277 [Triticum aestivum]KAF7077038.1 hypothetical protein CFC21_081630 [Triticum aestivum]